MHKEPSPEKEQSPPWRIFKLEEKRTGMPKDFKLFSDDDVGLNSDFLS